MASSAPSGAISTRDLTKIYSDFRGRRSVTALDRLSLDVEHQEVFGLLGPNGAGKTTLLKILLAVVRPTSGSAALLGKSVTDFTSRARIGFLPENHRFPPFLTALGALQTYGQLSGIEGKVIQKRADELLDRVGLVHWKNDRIKDFSKGMAQRLGIAQALINDPEILFLDEPTDGVDPIGRREIRDLLSSLREDGKTVFLNSHLLSEVEMICDRVAILHEGHLVKVGKVNELTLEGTGYRIELDALNSAEGTALDPALSSIELLSARLFPDGLFPDRLFPDRLSEQIGTVRLDTVKLDTTAPETPTLELKEASVEELNRWLDAIRSAGIMIKAVRPRYKSLEARFVETISDQDEDAGHTVGRGGSK